MKNYRLGILVILLTQSFLCGAQIERDAQEAFRVAGETQKPVLLVFAGSDWCAPCIRFEKQVLTENDFLEFAKENLVVLKADFPQRKKLPPAEQEQNDTLAEQYNPKGVFPKIVLVRLDKTVVSTLSYNNETSVEFIAQLKDSLLK
jgi:thiamine biosynthesis lipoprotein